MTSIQVETPKLHLSFQSVLGQRDDFSNVGLLVTLPSTSQLDLGTIEEGIAHHRIVILRNLSDVAVDWTTSLGVTQHTRVVDEWRRSLVRLSVELDQHPLDIEQVAIDGI